MSQSVEGMIHQLRQYDPNATVVFHPFRIENEDGTLATPLFRWYGASRPVKGDRVRKPGYGDTGTIITPSAGPSGDPYVLVYVKWDNSGSSWERVNDIGRSVE